MHGSRKVLGQSPRVCLARAVVLGVLLVIAGACGQTTGTGGGNATGCSATLPCPGDQTCVAGVCHVAGQPDVPDTTGTPDVPGGADDTTGDDTGEGTDAQSGPVCGDGTCDGGEDNASCPADCPATHYCDTHCGLKAPSGCSCATSCTKSGDCCGADGQPGKFGHSACAGSTCGQCKDGCVPKCDGKSCADGCGGVCDAKACDDKDACTAGDVCSSTGKCAGTVVSCDDANVCTSDACTASTGACKHDPFGGACEDGNACTTSDVCKGGACQPGPVDCICAGLTVCGDGDLCTIDGCDATTHACTHTAQVCDDANPCTTDACAAATGTCVTATDAGATPPPGSCAPVPCQSVGASCQDGAVTCTPAADVALDDTACGDTSVCAGGVCLPQVCTPATSECAGPDAQACASNGLSWLPVPCAAGTSCQNGACVNQLCAPGVFSCSGASVQVCDPLGLAQVATQDCAATAQVCSGGACVDPVCTPGTTVCTVTGVDTCQPDALGWVSTPCKVGESCLDGVCLPRICTPGAVTCVGAQVVKCNALGLAQDVQDDCGAVGQLCVNAACTPPLCVPGAVDCEGSVSRLCNADALSYTKTPCTSGQVCQGGACLWTLCTPSSTFCVGKQKMVCNAQGLDYTLVEDCGAQDQGCSAGGCVPLVCTPADNTCVGKVAQQCAPNGMGITPVTCSVGCLDGTCMSAACKAGTTTCQGSAILTCNALGTDAAITTDCAEAGQACVGGVCTDFVCAAGEAKCENGVSYTCSSDRLVWVPKPCAKGEICDGGTCKKELCIPDSVFCQGTFITQCDATGQVGTAVSNCAPSGQFCSGGACVIAVCLPGDVTCAGGNVQTCKSDGSGWQLKTSCDDYSTCTYDDCNPVTKACTNVKGSCDDGNPCTTDSCGGGNCAHSTGAYEGPLCDDGSACTTFDTCSGGTCASQPVAQIASVVGTGVAGFTDGPETVAQFSAPRQMARMADGSWLIADSGNNRIRRWVPGKGVTTFAGSGFAGTQDGPAWLAQFKAPVGLAIAANGVVYVGDTGNNLLRKIEGGQVQTVASVSAPQFLHFGPDGALWMSCGGSIKRLLADGTVSTWWGVVTAQGTDPGSPPPLGSGTFGDFLWSSTGELDYAFKASNWMTNRLTAATVSHPVQYSDGPAIGRLADDSILTIESGRLWRVHNGAKQYTMASAGNGAGVYISADFGGVVHNIVTDPADGSLLMSDEGHHHILRATVLNLGCDDGNSCTADVCAPGGDCTHTPLDGGVACTDGNACTTADTCDAGHVCQGGSPVDCNDGNVCTNDGCDVWTGTCEHGVNVAACDAGDACNLTTYCGAGTCKFGPAPLTTVSATAPVGTASNRLARLPDQTLVIADAAAQAIQHVAADGTLSALASGALAWGPLGYGAPGAVGSVAADSHGNLAFATGTQIGRVMAGQVVLWCGTATPGFADGPCAAAQFGALGALAYGPDGTLYALDPVNQRIRAISPQGVVTTLVGDGTAAYVDGAVASARVSTPVGLAVAPDGTLYFSDASKRVRSVVGAFVYTVAGGGGTTTSPVSASQLLLSAPSALAVDADGGVLVVDGAKVWRVAAGTATLSTLVSATNLAGTPDGGIDALVTGKGLQHLGPLYRHCDDASPCTADACDIHSGDCTHVPSPAAMPCSDGDKCTTADVCGADGACVGQATVCDDGTACSDDTCDPTSGACVHLNRAALCTEGSVCVNPKGCWEGSCRSDQALYLHLAGSSEAKSVDGDAWHARFVDSVDACADAAGNVYVLSTTQLRQITTDGTTTTLPLTTSPGTTVTGTYKHLNCGDTGPNVLVTTKGVYVRQSGPDWALRIATSSSISTGSVPKLSYNRKPVLRANGDLFVADLSSVCSYYCCDDYLAGFTVSPLGTLTKTGAIFAGSACVYSASTYWDDWTTGNYGMVYARDHATQAIWSFDGVTGVKVGTATWQGSLTDTERHTVRWVADGLLQEFTPGKGVTKLGGGTGAGLTTGDGPLATTGLPYVGQVLAAGHGRTVLEVGSEWRQVLVPDDNACDDGNPCTIDGCSADGQACTHEPYTGPCDDGDVCSTADQCVNGQCLGTVKNCGPNAVCAGGTCTSYFAGTDVLTMTQQTTLNTLLGKPDNSKWTPCFQGGGYTGAAYNLFSACKGKSPSVTVIRTTNGMTFGAYQTGVWGYSTDPAQNFYYYDAGAFLWSLDHGAKMPVNNSYVEAYWGWYLQQSMKGPQFGLGDLTLASDLASGTMAPGANYSTTGLACKATGTCATWFAGTASFGVAAVEVYAP